MEIYGILDYDGRTVAASTSWEEIFQCFMEIFDEVECIIDIQTREVLWG